MAIASLSVTQNKRTSENRRSAQKVGVSQNVKAIDRKEEATA